MSIKHTHVRVRRADLIRLKSSLEGLGGMFLTDAFHILSFATCTEIVQMGERAASRQDEHVASAPGCWCDVQRRNP